MNTNKSHLMILVSFLVVFVLSCCSPQVSVASNDETISGVDAGILSSRMLAEAENARDFCVRMVFAVMQANGGYPMSAGTYRIEAGGSGKYQPAPDDRLRVILPDGTQVDMVILTFDGSTTGDANQFLVNPYQLRVIVSAPHMDELMLVASQKYTGASLEMSGTVELDNQEYQVYLSQQTPMSGYYDGEANGETLGTRIQGVIALGEESYHVDVYPSASLSSENDADSQ